MLDNTSRDQPLYPFGMTITSGIQHVHQVFVNVVPNILFRQRIVILHIKLQYMYIEKLKYSIK